jgi:mannose-1-phosphate guanylyltransferase
LPESTNSSSAPDPHLWITILAGGSGTRFWPASTPRRPKQLLPLAGPQPLIRDTLDRARALAPDDRIRILTGKHLLEPFRGALGELEDRAFMVEPQAKGTAPVLVWAAWAIAQEDPDGVVVSLHADHAIQPLEKFCELIRSGAELAGSTEALFTVAIPPSRPETGYGYIQPGPPLPSKGALEAFKVQAFVEKPDAETASTFLEAGFLWNSGIFLWRAANFLREVQEVAPELGDLLPLLERGDVEGFFREAPAISVDKAVLERSSRVASLRATFEWDDVGSWESLKRTQLSDEAGNVLLGDARSLDSEGNIVLAEEGSVVLFGVHDMVVVRSGDIVLVADRARAADLKTLLKNLPPELRDPD